MRDMVVAVRAVSASPRERIASARSRSSRAIVTTLFPNINVPRLTLELAIFLGIGLVGFAIAVVVSQRRVAHPEPTLGQPARESWTMPQSALLGRPKLTLPVRLAMWVLRLYLVVAVVLLLVKAIQLTN